MKTALNQLKENIKVLIELNQSDIEYAKKVDSSSLHFKFVGIKQGLEMALNEIESLLPTERETTETLKKELKFCLDIIDKYVDDFRLIQKDIDRLKLLLEEF